MEFTSVELAGGAELAAPMETATTDPLEKAAVGLCTGEARGRREALWRGRKTGHRALERKRCLPTEWRRGGEGGVVKRETRWRALIVEAAWRSAVAESYHGAAVM